MVEGVRGATLACDLLMLWLKYFNNQKTTTMKHTTICICSLLGGMVLGSALAMAFTPKSGPEMRNLVGDFLNEEFEKWRKAYKEAMPACDCDQK